MREPSPHNREGKTVAYLGAYSRSRDTHSLEGPDARHLKQNKISGGSLPYIGTGALGAKASCLGNKTLAQQAWLRQQGT